MKDLNQQYLNIIRQQPAMTAKQIQVGLKTEYGKALRVNTITLNLKRLVRDNLITVKTDRLPYEYVAVSPSAAAKKD